jgi:hypothetical protein
VPWSDLVLHLLALVLYPGALAALAFGVAAEIAAAWALDRVGPRAALRSLLAGSRDAAGRLPGPVLLAALLEVLAATQLAVPFNPVSPVERSLLVAVVALAAASWLGWTPAWSAPAARGQLVVQACWLVALLAPALVAQTLRPQALGAVVVPYELPLKVLSALLALLCLPVLLRLAPDPADDEAAAPRLLAWLPLCGLFTSVFAPPGGDDVGSLLRFAGITLAVAAAAIGLAALAARRPRLAARWPRLAAPLAGVVLAAAVLTTLAT